MAERRPDRALGPGHDQFWDYCNQGELRIQRCDACGHLAFPVVQKCEACGDESQTWQKMSGRGKVIAWGCFERAYYQGVLPVPWNTILVELEEGPLFISNPKDFSWEDITPGLPVALDFLAAEDSAGEYQLPVFARA